MKSFALITGASSGLGAEYARLFARDRHGVILVARREERLEELATELADDHDIESVIVPADLSDPTAPERILEEVQGLELDVEYLINNAGFGSTGPFAELPLGRELDMIQVNVASLVHLTGLFLPAMLHQKRGAILNVASMAGLQPGPNMATYYATKAFVVSWSEALAYELRHSGVTVTVSCPGAIATEFSKLAGNHETPLFESGGVPAREVARDGYRAMRKGRRRIIHGFKNRLMAFGSSWVPRGSVLGMAAKINTPAK